MKVLYVLAALAGVASAHPAQASVYSDDLARCLVERTSDTDKAQLMRWVFVAMAANPAVKSLAAVSPEQRTDITAHAGRLMMRLLTKDCRTQSVAALKYDGQSSLEASFSVLGQVAMRGMMTDPSAAATLGELGKALNEDELRALFKEAGIQVPAVSAPAATGEK